MRHPLFSYLFPVAVLLAGCATDGAGRYPSLARRPIESRGFDEPVRPAPVVVADPALDARLATHAASLDRIAAGFATAVQTARRDASAASRAAAGSEAWLTAQAALAQLDDWRAQATALSAAIEAEGSARAAQLLPPYPALEALQARAAAEAERETATAATLQSALPTG